MYSDGDWVSTGRRVSLRPCSDALRPTGNRNPWKRDKVIAVQSMKYAGGHARGRGRGRTSHERGGRGRGREDENEDADEEQVDVAEER